MSHSRHTARTYQAARGKFLEAVRGAGGRITSHLHPDKGIEGEDLYLDVAELGDTDAKDGLLIVSGTHGIEGYCGSFIQSALLHDQAQLEAMQHLKLVLVHGHNPYGFSWKRRTNENNVDLNRNYVDFSEELEMNHAYAEVKDLIVPAEFDPNSFANVEQWIADNAMDKLQTVVMSGQRIDPQGVFYGDTKPSWSRETMFRILPELFRTQQRVFAIDVHTGLGPFGHGDPIHAYPKGSKEYELLRDWYGEEMIAINAGEYADMVSAVPRGPLVSSLDLILPEHESYAFVIEYGTVELMEIFEALLADGCIHALDQVDTELGRDVKEQMYRAFFSEDEDWLGKIYDRMLWCLRGIYANA